MILFRRWFACWFLLATIVVEGPHDHDQASPSATEFFESCDQSTQHWDRHDPAPDRPDSDTCAICRHRLDQPLPVTPLAWLVVAGTPDRIDPISAAPLAGFSLRTRCRAPPLAV